MKSKKITRTFLSFLMAVALAFTAVSFTAPGTISSYAVENYGSLIDYPFTISDVRDGSSHSFTANSSGVKVLVYGNITGCTNTMAAVGSLSRMVPYLEGVTAYELDLNQGVAVNNVKTKASQLDSDKNLAISEWSDDFRSTYYRCTGAVGINGNYTLPLIVYVNGEGNIYDYSTGPVSDADILAALVEGGVEDTFSGRTVSPVDLGVQTHTWDEIRAFVNSHPVDFNAGPVYNVEPSSANPYNIGEVSQSTLNDGLNAVNQMRYIAGLSSNVTLDNSYNIYTQAAALTNAANNSLSHFPPQPEGMADDLYSIGYEGASHSNIAMGYSSLSASVVYGYMYDGNASNIAMVGHRRWILNPAMGKTGFGIVPSQEGYYYSAMYSFDNGGSSTATVSMWPAMNMPIEYFGNGYPWSFSTGSFESASDVSVELKNKKTGRTWNFNGESADGYFTVNNGGYALDGCIIFLPDGIDIKNGDVYTVKISGVMGNANIQYDVNFFSLGGSDNGGSSGNNNGGGSNDGGSNEGDNNGGSNDGGNTQNETEEALNRIENEETPAPETVNMYRLYNPNSGEHFYTSKMKEAKSLINGGWKYEGVAWVAPNESSKPVYRLYNNISGEHHYTTSMREAKNLYTTASGNNTDEDIKGQGWDFEGIGWYSADGGSALYRLYNPNATGDKEPGSHHYTKSKKERDSLMAIGWRDEGIGWYGL